MDSKQQQELERLAGVFRRGYDENREKFAKSAADDPTWAMEWQNQIVQSQTVTLLLETAVTSMAAAIAEIRSIIRFERRSTDPISNGIASLKREAAWQALSILQQWMTDEHRSLLVRL